MDKLLKIITKVPIVIFRIRVVRKCWQYYEKLFSEFLLSQSSLSL